MQFIFVILTLCLLQIDGISVPVCGKSAATECVLSGGEISVLAPVFFAEGIPIFNPAVDVKSRAACLNFRPRRLIERGAPWMHEFTLTSRTDYRPTHRKIAWRGREWIVQRKAFDPNMYPAFVGNRGRLAEVLYLDIRRHIVSIINFKPCSGRVLIWPQGLCVVFASDRIGLAHSPVRAAAGQTPPSAAKACRSAPADCGNAGACSHPASMRPRQSRRSAISSSGRRS